MITHLRYGDKNIEITPYLTLLEKNILLYDAMHDDGSLDDLLSLLKEHISVDISTLTLNEKYAILYKLRTISVGDTIDIKYNCSKCGKPNESALSVDNIIQNGTINNFKGYKLRDALSDNINDYFIDIDADELDIDEYEEVENYILKNKINFDFNPGTACISCKHINNVNIKDKSFLIENMSEDTLSSFYKNVSDLVFYGRYTKMDIDSMIPFERTLYIGLLNQKIEETNS